MYQCPLHLSPICTSSSSFLLLYTLKAAADDPSTCIPATHAGDLDWVPCSWLWLASAPDLATIWWVTQGTEDLSVSISAFQNHFYNMKNVFLYKTQAWEKMFTAHKGNPWCPYLRASWPSSDLSQNCRASPSSVQILPGVCKYLISRTHWTSAAFYFRTFPEGYRSTLAQHKFSLEVQAVASS